MGHGRSDEILVVIRIREFLKEFFDCGIDFVKAAHHRFGNSLKIPRLAVMLILVLVLVLAYPVLVNITAG